MPLHSKMKQSHFLLHRIFDIRVAGSLLSALHLRGALTPYITVWQNSRRGIVEGMLAVLQKAIFLQHTAGCGELFCASDKSRTGPQEPTVIQIPRTEHAQWIQPK